jgi:hypothetical protein
MPSRRKFLLVLVGAVQCAGFVASPFRLTIENGTPGLAAGTAAAKDGRSKGNGGNGNGGKGKGSKGDGSGESGGKKGGSLEGTEVNSKTGDRVHIDGSGIEVVHRNGMRERVYRGSYKMTDSKGRTIIERRATGADLARLRRMAG